MTSIARNVHCVARCNSRLRYGKRFCTSHEKGKHYLQRFWEKLPDRGQIVVFDRSWYGRVLVERVEEIASKREWQRGYEEINQFERMLVADGIRRNASRAWPLGHR